MEKTFQEEFNKINLRFDKNENSHETLKSDVEILKIDLNAFKAETKQHFAEQRKEMHMLHEDTKNFIFKVFQDFGTVQDHTPDIQDIKIQLKDHEGRIQIIEKILHK